VSDGIPLQVCDACGSRFFPYRLACSRCGSRAFSTAVVAEGVVEETTTVRRAPGGVSGGPVVVATVHVHEGPRVVARLDGDVQAAANVRLSLASGAPVASRDPSR
jgi:uncharacterized OB-fold protein